MGRPERETISRAERDARGAASVVHHRGDFVRPALTGLGLVGFATGIFLTVGRLGFNPTDEGYILAQSYRLLQGELPHRDIISPLLMGSPILHVLDFALPLPLLESSRLLAAIEVVAYSACLASLALPRPVGRAGLPLVLGAAASALINLHVFPLMASHTVDGLLFASAGFLLLLHGLDARRRGPAFAGLVLLGSAGVMKLSFLLAPVLGLALFRHAGAEGLPGAAIAAALPATLYFGVVAAGGGLGEMLRQVGGASPVTGGELLAPFRAGGERMRAVGLIALAGGVFGALAALRGAADPRARIVLLAESLFVMLGTALLAAVPFGAELARAGTWGTLLLWMLVAATLVDLLVARSADRAAVILLALAGMTALSYGYPVPNLVAGSVAVYLVSRVWEGFPPRLLPRRLAAPLLTVSAAVAVAFMAHTALAIRARRPYFDRPAPLLTEGLADVAPAFGDIRTNSITATYLRQMKACLAQYPASRAAVLPDNAFAYPVFGLRNALPITWLQWRLTRGSQLRLVRAAQELHDEGDYVVLFQTVSAFALAGMQRLPDATPRSRPPPWLGSTLAMVLDGRRSECGSFIVLHAPPR